MPELFCSSDIFIVNSTANLLLSGQPIENGIIKLLVTLIKVVQNSEYITD